MSLYDDLTSRDSDRIWSSSCAVRHLRDRDELSRLASRLQEIKDATHQVELGGTLRPKSSHLEFALRKLEYVRDSSGCLCALYEMDDLYDPLREEKDGHVRISEQIPQPGQRMGGFRCECAYCGQRFEVDEHEYHYTWWQWKRA